MVEYGNQLDGYEAMLHARRVSKRINNNHYQLLKNQLTGTKSQNTSPKKKGNKFFQTPDNMSLFSDDEQDNGREEAERRQSGYSGDMRAGLET